MSRSDRGTRLLRALKMRLREPSTYAGLGVLALAIGKSIPEHVMAGLVVLGSALAGVLAIYLPERPEHPADGP